MLSTRHPTPRESPSMKHASMSKRACCALYTCGPHGSCQFNAQHPTSNSPRVPLDEAHNAGPGCSMRVAFPSPPPPLDQAFAAY